MASVRFTHPVGRSALIRSYRHLYIQDELHRRGFIRINSSHDVLCERLLHHKLLDCTPDHGGEPGMAAGSMVEGGATCRLLKGEEMMELDQLHIITSHGADTEEKFTRNTSQVAGCPAYYTWPGLNRIINRMLSGGGVYTAPAMAGTYGDTGVPLDIVVAFQLNFWPPVARGWANRPRTWPPAPVVEDIVSRPCFMVHKPSGPGSLHLDEAYLSFSYGEQTLAHCRTDGMKFTYYIFKSIFYNTFKFKVDKKEFGSYLAKTVMLWSCEKLAPDIWTDDNLHDNLCYLFTKLLDSLENRHISHYWVPQLNLLRTHPDRLFDLFNSEVNKEILTRDPLSRLPSITQTVMEKICDEVRAVSIMNQFNSRIMRCAGVTPPDTHIVYWDPAYHTARELYHDICIDSTEGYRQLYDFHTDNPGLQPQQLLAAMLYSPDLTRGYFTRLSGVARGLNFYSTCLDIYQRDQRQENLSNKPTK